jgi:hypothetical protein
MTEKKAFELAFVAARLAQDQTIEAAIQAHMDVGSAWRIHQQGKKEAKWNTDYEA